MKLLSTFLSLILLCVCSTANADDSWVYPKQSSGIAGNCNLHNESNAIFWSRDIDDDFDTIVNWYARKLKATALTQALEKYSNRGEDASDISQGSVTAINLTAGADSHSSAVITYFLTPEHKHVTILHPTSQGKVIVISIAGTSKRTSVQLVEKQAK